MSVVATKVAVPDVKDVKDESPVLKDSDVTVVMPTDKFSATATEDELKTAANDEFRVWHDGSNFCGFIIRSKPKAVYESWDEMRKSEPFTGNRTWGCPIINSYWEGLDLDDDQSVEEWDPKKDREKMHLFFLGDNGTLYHYACKVLRDANHDAAIKATLRENRKKWFRVDTD
jgi:hypothetical protein